MSKSCVVLASFHPRPECFDEVRQLLLDVIPDVHQEPGCELFALHEEVEGLLILIEKWSTRELWQSHLGLDTVKRIQAGVAGKLVSDVVVNELYGVPVGEPHKGALA